jgi:hypothetical protein
MVVIVIAGAGQEKIQKGTASTECQKYTEKKESRGA